MKRKRRILETQTILIILIAIAIVCGGYLIITNLPPEEDYLTPEEVLANIDHYTDQKIKIRGYYDISGGYPVIVSTMSTTEGRSELRFDYTNIENATDNLFEGEKYDFTGDLKKTTPTGFDVILILDDFKKV
jgi:cytochrome c-type biogenesis protein CcmE